MEDLDCAEENEKKVSSVLEGEGYYFNKILNRGSSIRSGSGSSQNDLHIHVNVPFEWESHPGTPKASETTSMEKVPQIIRPPPFPTTWECGGDLSVKSSTKGWTGLVFWRKSKKHRNRNMGGRKNVDKRRSVGLRRNERLGFGSDDNFATSSSSPASYNCNWSSSSSPALSRNKVHSLPSSTSKLRGVSKRLIKWPF